MRTGKLIVIIVFAISCISSTTAGYHRVKFVYDGDTILLDNGEKVRYLEVDAPEIDHTGGKDEFMARAARDFNIKRTDRARVRLEYDREKRDRYGRLLAYVFLENGSMVNALLVRNGLAHVMFKDRNFKHKEDLLYCQRQAMKERLGIWSRPLEGDEKFYLGNRSSYRFHRPGCPFANKISRRNILMFRSRRDAFWEGYSPCNKCRP